MKRLAVALAMAVMVGSVVAPAAEARSESRMFGLGYGVRLEELPDGRLTRELRALPEPARQRALARLQRFSFPAEDIPSLSVDEAGGVFYVCEAPAARLLDADTPTPGTQGAPMEIAVAAVPVSPFPPGLAFNSRPGSRRTIYLNFVGATVSNTAWNLALSRTSIPALAFSTDGDYTQFSDAEQTTIRRVWQRVAEDYAPFDVNVTTVAPKSVSWLLVEVLITRNTDANGANNYNPTAGGVAYIDIFDDFSPDFYSPAWVYHNNLSNVEAWIAEAASHEAGHNFGLSHDGKTDGTSYYAGHGSGATSWGTIMGAGYDRNVTQWSKGEYALANNLQDDLAIIANRLGYRFDDHGDTFSTASPLAITNYTRIQATTPESDPDNLLPANKGVLERSSDTDVWSFSCGVGSVDLTVRPWVSAANARGGNLDLKLSLYNAAGVLLAENDPAAETFASVTAAVTGGLYYLKVEGIGAGNPLASPPAGYTDYGSLGQYFITGVVAVVESLLVPQARLEVAGIEVAGATSQVFRVVYSDYVGIQNASLGNDDVRVAGPLGNLLPVAFVTSSGTSDGSPRVGTYQIAAPGGQWDIADNGTYTVYVTTQAVRNVGGDYVPSGALGTFVVAIPTDLYSANMNVNPGWFTNGVWAYGVPNGTNGAPASAATGTNAIGHRLSGSSFGFGMAYAATPLIDCTQAGSVILRFQRWLVLRTNDTAVIEVSADGLGWTRILTLSNAVTDTVWSPREYDISAYAARRTGVRVRWGNYIFFPDASAWRGWMLDDVVLAGVLSAAAPVPPGVQQCTLSPALVRDQGAAWGLSGGAVTNWLSSGASVSVADTGSYSVVFREVAGWQMPAPVPVTIASGVTNRIEAVYGELLTSTTATPLWWLLANGVTQNYEVAAEDVAANGMRYWESYIAGVNPGDTGSALRIEGLLFSPAGAGFTFRWSAVSGRVYSVIGSAAPGTNGALPVVGGEALRWPQNSFTNPPGDGPYRFYRLGVRLDAP